MGEREQIFKEIFHLLDEQTEVLKQRLTTEDAREYRWRAERIRQLLEKLSADGFRRELNV